MRYPCFLALVAVWTPAAAQAPQTAQYMAHGRFGRRLVEQYRGTMSWSWIAGTSVENADATLGNGLLTCVVTYRSEEGSFRASGPGLIEISLGVEPDEENPPAREGGKMYTIRAACPHPRGRTGAAWSHSFDTYKRKCGDFTANGDGPETWIVPRDLRGTWSEDTGDQEHMSMTWRLCRIPDPCSPLPAPDPNKPPPPPDPCQ